VAFTVQPLAGQEAEFYRNHFGGLVGVSTHHDVKDSGLTLGLDYARQFSRLWGMVSYIELVSSDLERDFILAVGGSFYPKRHLSLVLALGLESAEDDATRATEFAFLIRMGAGYGFRITDESALGPTLLVDWSNNRWTSLVAVAMVVGF